MKNLLYKEFFLSTPLITYLFLIFTVMTFIPGYPILCGIFFVCMGIFQGYQAARENSDILYSILLPVKKTDIVKAKYLSAAILQMTAFLMCSIFTFIRMFFLNDKAVYLSNVMMNANPVFLSFVLMIFASFNIIFIGGFFRNAYSIGKPFAGFTAVNFTIILVAETLHHLPALGWLNIADGTFVPGHYIILLTAFILYTCLTAISCRVSGKRFENTDL